jgi:hypothetical protein
MKRNVIYDSQAIKIIDNVLSHDFCNHLIEKFEESNKFHREIPTRLIELDLLNMNYAKKSTSNIFKSLKAYDWTADTNSIMESVHREGAEYKKTWDPLNILPLEYSAEGMRLKAYKPNVHEFKMHIDATSRGSASRFIAFLFYLNDSDAATEFPLQEVTVEAKQGRLAIFPPTWQYPHQGLMPKNGNKYILSTYFHYLPDGEGY